ncbi:MAG: membrane protein insertion efficiency factor YidD [Elusimicrobia bacterium]|nr:membrane protein insertion efficiency factor YidD [Elusimicrobiota bacterium]
MLKRILLIMIQLYQASAFLFRPRCRFWPTCSQYTYEAIEIHGVARGIGLGLKRLSRCHPLGRSGYDPVPLSEPSCQKTF